MFSYIFPKILKISKIIQSMEYVWYLVLERAYVSDKWIIFANFCCMQTTEENPRESLPRIFIQAQVGSICICSNYLYTVSIRGKYISARLKLLN